MTYYIKDALKKQFDLLSQASGACVDGDELSTLTHAMLQVCEFLERIEQDEAAQHSPDKCSRPAQMDLHAADRKTVAALRKGVLEHGIPDGLMIDDGEKVRPCWRGGPMNSRGKMVERLMRDLEAAGALVEVFNGKSGAEIMDELVKLLKMYSVSLEIAKETWDILHDLTRKDEKMS